MQKKRDARRSKRKATTHDIIGSRQAQPPVQPRWKNHYNRLVELRERLLQSQSNLERDANEELPSFSSHMADAATDTFDRDLALSMLSNDQDALYQVEQALDRLRTGRYGVCELTGKPIEPDRLEAIPWTRFSLHAERQLEEQGARKLARLAPREAVSRSGDSDGEGDAESE